MDLPTNYTGEVHFYYWTILNRVKVHEYKPQRLEKDPDHIYLGSAEVTAEFNVNHDEALKQAVNKLQKQKQTLQAETQRELNTLDEKINSLLAITHQPES